MCCFSLSLSLSLFHPPSLPLYISAAVSCVCACGRVSDTFYMTAEEPRQRISSHALLAWCIQKIEQIRHIPGSTDADLFAWATTNMTAPPEPTAGTAIPNFDPNDPSDKQVSGGLQTFTFFIHFLFFSVCEGQKKSSEITKLA